MSININCKKKWHPSRYETQKELEKINNKNTKNIEYNNKRYEEDKRNKLNDVSERMSWMYDN